MISVMIVPAVAIMYSPAPDAIPTAALTQMVAAGGMSLAETRPERDTDPARRAHALDPDCSAARVLGARPGVQDRGRVHPHPARHRADPVHRKSGHGTQDVGLKRDAMTDVRMLGL